MSEEHVVQQNDKTGGIKVSSLAKALRILECFSSETAELGITEISNTIGMNKSSVSNMISTFCQMGYIQKCSSGKYALGLRFLEFSFIVNKHLGYSGAVHDIVFEVSDCTGMISYFGIPWYSNVLYLDVVHPSSLFSERPYVNILGETAPLYSTGIGKAILSAMPEEEWESRIPQVRKIYTENTLTAYDDIIEELKRTRTRGYAIDNMEKEPGLKCTAVPVYDKRGRLVAGLSVSGPAAGFTDERIVEFSNILRTAATKMQERLYH